MGERTLQSQIDDLIDRESDSLRAIADGQAAFHRGYRACLANLRRQLTDLNPTPTPPDVPVCPVKGCGRQPMFFTDAAGGVALGCTATTTHPSVVSRSRTVEHYTRLWQMAVAAYHRDPPEETSDA